MGSFGGNIKPFKGRQNLKFEDYEVRDTSGAKGLRHWICMKFVGDDGEFASTSFNLWPNTDDDGCKKGNRISMRTLTSFWMACGLDDGTMPDDEMDKIKEALNNYKGEITVSGEVFDDYNPNNQKTYTSVKNFEKAK